MALAFQKATKQGSYANIAIAGPTGSGKTYTGLQIATTLAGDKPVAVLDTERGSARLYADKFDFDVIELDSFSPENYREVIKLAVDNGYGCLLIDSLSHAWMGKDGVLEYKDQVAKRQGKDSHTAWAEAGKEQNALIDAILAAPIHIVVTMRSKMEYVRETNPKTGQFQIRKLGLQPVQRDGVEYEFTIVADIDDATLCVDKTRCEALPKGKAFEKDGAAFAQVLLDWLTDGGTLRPEVPAPPAPETATPAPVAPTDAQDPEDALLAKLLADPKTTPKMAEYLNALRQYNCKLAPAIKGLCRDKGTDKLSNLMDTHLDAAIAALHEEFGALADAAVGVGGKELF